MERNIEREGEKLKVCGDKEGKTEEKKGKKTDKIEGYS